MGKQLPENEKIKKLYFDGYVEGAKLAYLAYTDRLAAEQTLRMMSLYAPSKSPDPTVVKKLRLKEERIQKRLEDDVSALTKELRKPGVM